MSLQDNTIAYQVSIHRWGIKRKVNPGVLQSMLPSERILIEKKMLGASKRIIESPEYDKIAQRDGAASRWLAEHSVPSILKKGVYLLPVLFCNDVDTYMQEYDNERRFYLVPNFLAVYEEQVELARLTLGADLYNSLEYPTKDQMEGLFFVETSYISFDAPQQLRHISEELFRREQEKVQQAWENAEREINQLLVQECAELVEGLQRALTGLSDGTLKRFKEANMINLTDWAALFMQARNVTENQELEALVAQIQDTLQGITRDDLKHDRGSLRQYVQSAMAGIQTELKGMLEDMPERMVQFAD